MARPQDPRALPADQASGLRRLFGAARPQRVLLPVAANPFVRATPALLDVLAQALAQRGREVLVVDASGTAALPHELACVDLAAGIERIDEHVSVLSARGLPLAHVDTRGSAAAFIERVFDAAPSADAVLLHADPSDLARLLTHRAVRPLLVAADDPEALKQAYAGAKLLVQRAALMTFDFVLAAGATPRAPLIVDRLAACADQFLGAVLRTSVVLDPLGDAFAAHDAALGRLLGAQLAGEGRTSAWMVHGAEGIGAAAHAAPPPQAMHTPQAAHTPQAMHTPQAPHMPHARYAPQALNTPQAPHAPLRTGFARF